MFYDLLRFESAARRLPQVYSINIIKYSITRKIVFRPFANHFKLKKVLRMHTTDSSNVIRNNSKV